MKVVVTGGAGFIGSCLIHKLNAEGINDIIVVDKLGRSEGWKNLVGKRFTEYLDKDALLDYLAKHKCELILHMGACSSTTETDVSFLMENNYGYTQKLALWALKNKAHFIYASSGATYGDGRQGYSDDNKITPKLKPLNAYGYSKQIFDLWLLENGYDKKFTGFKFFNVFGPNEYHKGDMRSLVAKAYPEILQGKGMKLFKSYKKEYGDGDQKRDFVYIKDVLEVVWYFIKHPRLAGIYNVGTGRAESWNELAKAMFAAAGLKPEITYIEMPEVLKNKYQYFTLADISKLRAAGYKKEFSGLNEAVKDYAGYLKDGLYL